MYRNDRTLRKMSLGDVLDYSIEVYKRNFKKITFLALVFYIPFTLLYALFGSYLSGQMMDLLGADSININDNNTIYGFFAYYFLIIGASFLYFLYTITLKPVMDAAIAKLLYSDIVYQKEENLNAIIKQSFKKFPSLLVNKILYSLIIFGISMAALIVFYILVFVSIFGFLFTYNTPGTTISPISIVGSIGLFVVIIAFLLAIVFFIAYFAVKFGFGTHAIIIEDKTATQGISRSSELTKKNFWHVTLAYVFGWILFFIIPVLLSSAGYVMININKALYMLFSTIGQVISALLYPYMMTLLTVLFVNLKIRKEGLDLELKVDKLLEEQSKLLSNGDGETADVVS